jgi:hypothetical protein
VMRLLRRFGGWLDRRGWGVRQAWATALAGLAAGVFTIDAARDTSGIDQVVAVVVGVACILTGLFFGAAVLVIRRDRPRSAKAKVTDSSFRWPTRRGRDRSS